MSQIVYTKLIKDIGVVGSVQILQGLSILLLIPIITKSLGAYDYGIYVQLIASISLITSFATLGLPYAMVRFLAGENDKDQIVDDIWSSVTIIVATSLVISVIIFLCCDIIAPKIFGDIREITIILAILIPIECLSGTLQNVFRVFQKLRTYSAILLVKTYLEIVVIIVLLYVDLGIHEVIFSIFAVRTLICLGLILTVIHHVGIIFPKYSRIRDYFKFGFPTIPANVAFWITSSSDRYIIGLFLGLSFVGYYNPGYILGEMISIFMMPIDFVFVAAASKYYDESKFDLLRDLFKRSVKYYLLFTFPAFCGVSILAEPILLLISTPEIANQGYIVTPFVAFGMLVFGLGAVAFGKPLFLAKKTHISMINWIFVAAINVSLNFILIPIIGLVGAALATMLSFTFGFIFGTYFSIRYFDFVVDWKSIIKILISSAIMSFVLFQLSPSDPVDLLATISFASIVYLVSIFSLKTISSDEINFFKRLLPHSKGF